MKKLIFVLGVISLLFSCTEQTVPEQTVPVKSTNIVTSEGNNTIRIVEIEGCEYLEYERGHQYSLCHKGNCKNPIHPENNK